MDRSIDRVFDDTTSDKQIYGDGLGQAPGDGLGQANILNIHLNKTLIRAGDGLGQVNKCNMHLLNTLIQPRTWTRTSKYTDMDSDKHPDMDSDKQLYELCTY